MVNQVLHKACRDSGVKKWEVAEALGIADGTLSRMLRRELPDQEKEKILNIIKRLAQEVCK